MGGGLDSADRATVLSALDWWVEAGVDVVMGEEARHWLEEEPASPFKISEPESAPHTHAPAPAVQPAPVAAPAAISTPDTLSAFQEMLREADGLPFVLPGSARILPSGKENAPLMVMAGLPGADEAASGTPIGGNGWLLAEKMLAAIGIASDDAYLAAFACGYSPTARSDAPGLEVCAKLAREHVRLAKPQRLLIFGDAPSEALLGAKIPRARGRVHKVEGVRTVATFSPRYLLQRPADKALAWKDLQLLMSDDE